MILAIVGGVMITYEIAIQIVKVIVQTDRDGAKRIISKLFEDISYDIQNDRYFLNEIILEYYNLMNCEQIDKLCKLLKKDYLFEFSSNGFPCLNLYVDIEDEKKIFAEQRFRDILSENLYLHGLYREVLVDWKKFFIGTGKEKIGIDYLCLRYAKEKKDEEYIIKCNEEERRKIAKTYKKLADDDVEINE